MAPHFRSDLAEGRLRYRFVAFGWTIPAGSVEQTGARCWSALDVHCRIASNERADPIRLRTGTKGR